MRQYKHTTWIAEVGLHGEYSKNEKLLCHFPRYLLSPGISFFCVPTLIFQLTILADSSSVSSHLQPARVLGLRRKSGKVRSYVD
jgi:hypothetical protein